MRETMTSKEEFTKILREGYENRVFIVGHLKDFTFHLSTQEAYVFSRLVPKELIEKLLSDRQMGPFMDKVLDYHKQISLKGPVAELEATKAAEETFLAGKGFELLSKLLLVKV